METCRIQVRLTPRAARNEVIGWQGDILRVRVNAPPVDGRANEALIELLARRLSTPETSLRLVQGTKARNKVIEVVGLTEEEVRSRLDSQTSHKGSGSDLKKDISN
jgi:uncharacterized protein